MCVRPVIALCCLGFSLASGCRDNAPKDPVPDVSLATTSVSRQLQAASPKQAWLRLELANPQQWWARLASGGMLPEVSPRGVAVAVAAALGLPSRIAGRVDLRRPVLFDVGVDTGDLAWVAALPIDSGAELVADLTLGSRAQHRAREIHGGTVLTPSPEGLAWGVAGRYLLVATTARTIERRGVPLASFALRERAPSRLQNASGTAWVGGSALGAAREFSLKLPGSVPILPAFLNSVRERTELRGTLKLSDKEQQIVARFLLQAVPGVDVCPSLAEFLPSGIAGVALDGTAVVSPGLPTAGSARATVPSMPRRFALRDDEWQELPPELLRPMDDERLELTRLIQFWSRVPSLRTVCGVPQLALVGLANGISLSLSTHGELLIQVSQAFLKNTFGDGGPESKRP